ncbi:MAG: restriction endonuclease subunit S [Candidatus Aminicenantales bacterium]|jgi:type I restriction enzyme S subunit
MNRWLTKPLEEIADVYGGSTPSRDNPAFWGGDIPWVTPTDLPMPDEGISVVRRTNDCITQAGLDNSSASVVPKGAVLFSSRATIGKVAVADMPLTTNQGFANFIPHAEVTSRFLAYALWVRREDIARLSGSTTFKEVRRSTLRKYPLPVPPLEEQERLVKLLDEADELRKLRAKADRHTAELIPALFHEMFGDPKVSVKTLSIEDVIERFIDYRGKTPEKSANGIPLVTARIVKGGRILQPTEFIREALYESWMRRGLPKTGDVLFTMEAPLGEVAIVEDARIALAQRILLMRPRADVLNSQYFMTALKVPAVWKQIEERATGSTVRGIRQAELRKVHIPVPSLPLQRGFSDRVNEIRNLEADQAASRLRLEALFQSLLHRAFNGEL